MPEGNDEMPNVRAPAWRFEWNLNTIVILIGFGAGVAAWGATWERMSAGQLANAEDIRVLGDRVSKVEGFERTINNHEFRISNMEQQVTDAASAMRDVQDALNGLAADMRVTREILQRIEASQQRREDERIPP